MLQICRVCKIEKPIEEFQIDSRTKTGHTKVCKPCAAKLANEWHKRNRDSHNKKMNEWRKQDKDKNPEKYLLIIAKRRAQETGRVFDLTPEDISIPEYCPVLGIKLQYGVKSCRPESPSLDAIIPEKGYIRGNVAVISFLANSIKQNASPDEIRKVADWLERTLKSLESSLSKD